MIEKKIHHVFFFQSQERNVLVVAISFACATCITFRGIFCIANTELIHSLNTENERNVVPASHFEVFLGFFFPYFILLCWFFSFFSEARKTSLRVWWLFCSKIGLLCEDWALVLECWALWKWALWIECRALYEKFRTLLKECELFFFFEMIRGSLDWM